MGEVIELRQFREKRARYDEVAGQILAEFHARPEPTSLDSAARWKRLRTLLLDVPDLEAAILIKRYGLADGKKREPHEVGALFGMDEEQVERVEKRGMARLRRP